MSSILIVNITQDALTLIFLLILFFKKINVYLFLRERERTSGGGAERARDIESKAGSRLRAVSTEPDMGLKPTSHKIMT